ncbi:MAG TPA: hypothetical protein VKA31_00995, partial [Mariprofundaceae bacterium]|nr:hypothetical protein [Mariprofundaceae bacterium]
TSVEPVSPSLRRNFSIILFFSSSAKDMNVVYLLFIFPCYRAANNSDSFTGLQIFISLPEQPAKRLFGLNTRASSLV